jgi:hypothetical protein
VEDGESRGETQADDEEEDTEKWIEGVKEGGWMDTEKR